MSPVSPYGCFLTNLHVVLCKFNYLNRYNIIIEPFIVFAFHNRSKSIKQRLQFGMQINTWYCCEFVPYTPQIFPVWYI